MSALSWFWIGAAALLVGSLFATLSWCVREATRGGAEDVARKRGRPAPNGAVGRVLDASEAHAASAMVPSAIGFSVLVLACVMWVHELRQPDATALGVISWLDAVLGIALAAMLRWVFGVVVPTAIADHASNQAILGWAWLVHPTHLVLSPLGVLGTGLSEVVRRLVGGPTGVDETREELMSVVEEGEREGQFDETERDMIEAVVEFRSRTVEEIMTPRTEVQALQYTDDLSAIKAFMREVGHSRIPVYQESLDHVVGVLYAKDLLRWMSREGGESRPFVLRDVVRAPAFVPETKTVRELLAELLARRVHLAIVADEYGGTAGVVTIEDIVEEVFGEIHDEYETGTELVPSVVIDKATRSAEIDARASIDDANDVLEPIGIELPEGEEYDTVGGMVMTMLGHIPARGEVLRHNGFVLTVLEAAPTRVERVRVEFGPEPEPPQGK